MNRVAMMRAAYFGVLADPADGNPTVRAVQAMVFRMYARKFHNSEVAAFLKQSRTGLVTTWEQPGNALVTELPRKIADLVTDWEQDGNARAGVAKVLELEDTSPNGDGASKAAKASTTHKEATKPLQFDLDNTVRSSEILALIWTRIGATMGRSITKTQWGKQNRSVARDLARVGRTDGEIIAAFDSHVTKRGLPLTVKAVQTELGYLDAGPAPARRFDAGTAVQTIPKDQRR